MVYGGANTRPFLRRAVALNSVRRLTKDIGWHHFSGLPHIGFYSESMRRRQLAQIV